MGARVWVPARARGQRWTPRRSQGGGTRASDPVKGTSRAPPWVRKEGDAKLVFPHGLTSLATAFLERRASPRSGACATSPCLLASGSRAHGQVLQMDVS